MRERRFYFINQSNRGIACVLHNIIKQFHKLWQDYSIITIINLSYINWKLIKWAWREYVLDNVLRDLRVNMNSVVLFQRTAL